MHQLILCGPASMYRLLQGVVDKSGRGRATDTPPNNAAGKDVDDKSHIHKPLSCRDIREVVVHW